MRDIWEWASANPNKFVGRAKSDAKGFVMEPHGGWLGRWDKEKWGYVAFLGTPLNNQLRALNYDVSATKRTWNDRGWLATDKQGRNQRQVTIEGSKVYCYCLKRQAIERELGITADPENTTEPMLFPSASENVVEPEIITSAPVDVTGEEDIAYPEINPDDEEGSDYLVSITMDDINVRHQEIDDDDEKDDDEEEDFMLQF